MERPQILHFFTPAPQVSPFDVNMAYDAGYQAVVPYTGMSVADIRTLTQDAIFSRGPKGVRRTGIFIGGRDLALALDMLDAARKAMVPPFEVSVLADPSGAFTTAAAAVAAVERCLRQSFHTELAGKLVLVLGGTGPVGTASAALAAQAGARVQLSSRSSLERARESTNTIGERYELKVEPVFADGDALQELVAGADVIICAAKAGVQMLGAGMLAKAASLLVAADVNAVPPAGIAGIGVMDNCAPLDAGSGRAKGIGALAIGNVKYQVERGLFEQMLSADAALYLDFRHAFEKARDLVQRSG